MGISTDEKSYSQMIQTTAGNFEEIGQTLKASADALAQAGNSEAARAAYRTAYHVFNGMGAAWNEEAQACRLGFDHLRKS